MLQHGLQVYRARLVWSQKLPLPSLNVVTRSFSTSRLLISSKPVAPRPLLSPLSRGGSRFMATFRDLGYGPGGKNRRSGGYGGRGFGNSFMRFFQTYRSPILFTLATLGVSHFVLPPLINNVLPGLKRNPDLVVYGLMAVNLAAFLAWKSPGAGSRFMARYGLLYKDPMRFNVWGMLGSAFSHQEFWHIGVNMFVLYNFGMPLARWIGSDQFLSAYLDGAVLSSLGSLMLPVLIRRYTPIPSLGASGAVFTVFGIFTYLVPTAKLALFFIPLPIGAWPVFLCTAAYNAAGMFMRFGGSDYAGHLAGSIAGIAWGYYLSEKAKKARQRRQKSFLWV